MFFKHLLVVSNDALFLSNDVFLSNDALFLVETLLHNQVHENDEEYYRQVNEPHKVQYQIVY